MELFRIKKDIPFMRHALIFNVISALTFVAAVFFLFHKSLNLSVEFTGGTVMEVSYTKAADVVAIRQTVENLGFADVPVNSTDKFKLLWNKKKTAATKVTAEITLNISAWRMKGMSFLIRNNSIINLSFLFGYASVNLLRTIRRSLGPSPQQRSLRLASRFGR